MRRGEIYLVTRPTREDPRRRRAVVLVSRDGLFETTFTSVVCAPVYSRFEGVETQVQVGSDEGMQHPSAVFCDNLLSIPRRELTNFVGSLGPHKLSELNRALEFALGLGD